MKKFIALVFIIISMLGVVGCNQQRGQEIIDSNQGNELAIASEDGDEIYFDEELENLKLIPAIGINGVEGYVYASDIDGKQPSTPEEALEYMRKLDAEISAAKEDGHEYLRYIPLYKSDGVTVIGEFGITYSEE